MKRALRPRASLARRFVDWYLSTIARASRPMARMKLFFVLVTASFFVHMFVVYGDYVLGDAQLPRTAKLKELEPEKPLKVSMRAPEDLAKVMQAILEQEKILKQKEKELEDEAKKEPEKKKEEEKKEAPKKTENESIAEKAKNDDEVKRKTLLTEREQQEKPQKNAKNKGGDTDNMVGVTEKPKDEKLALQGITESAKEVKEKPNPELAAKTPKELEESAKAKEPKVETKPAENPLAHIDGEEKPKGPLMDPKAEVAIKKEHPGESKENRDGEVPKAPKPDPLPPPPAPLPPPPPPPPAPPPPPPPPAPVQPKPLPLPPPVESGENGKITKPAPPIKQVEPSKQVKPVVGPGFKPPEPKNDVPKPPVTPAKPDPQQALAGPVNKAPAKPAVPNNKNPDPNARPRADAPRKPAPREEVVTDHTDYKKNAVVVEKNLKALDDWISYTLEGSPQLKDTNVPGLFITNTSEEEWKDIISHFDLCPIAFPDTADRFMLVDVFNLRPRALEKDQVSDLKDHYASSGIRYAGRRLRAITLFRSAAEKVCSQFGIAESKINLMILLPPKVMSYIAWKALRTIKDEGCDQKKVRACHTRFARTTDGWILKVTDIVLEDGTVKQVKA